MKNKNGFLLCILLCIFASCNTYKKISYFQDSIDGTVVKTELNTGIVIQPKDMLSIVVSSKDPELAVPFNLPMITLQAGTNIASQSAQRILGYVVDNKGCIDFPILGSLKISGLTRWQLADTIKHRLIAEELLKDPVITVQFLNFSISVIGEVNAPNTYYIENDRINLLEAISLAKDLTIHGKRDNVKVMREKDGIVTTYCIDLRSKALFQSPVYYLQQNDIVYVEPSKVRAGQSRINENNFKSVSLWMSVVSVLTTLSVLIFK